MKRQLVSFEVVSNLKYAADLQAATEVVKEGISKKSGKAFTLHVLETPITFLGVKVGTMSARVTLPYPKLQEDGTYTLIQRLSWESYLSDKNKWISVKEENLVKDGYVLFYEEDQTNAKGEINHVKGYSKNVGGVNTKLWVYPNKKDRTNETAVRASIDLEVTTYEEVK